MRICYNIIRRLVDIRSTRFDIQHEKTYIQLPDDADDLSVTAAAMATNRRAMVVIVAVCDWRTYSSAVKDKGRTLRNKR